jgi:hypothetical protein
MTPHFKLPHSQVHYYISCPISELRMVIKSKQKKIYFLSRLVLTEQKKLFKSSKELKKRPMLQKHLFPCSPVASFTFSSSFAQLRKIIKIKHKMFRAVQFRGSRRYVSNLLMSYETMASALEKYHGYRASFLQQLKSLGPRWVHV